jgi:hypothetical protein
VVQFGRNIQKTYLAFINPLKWVNTTHAIATNLRPSISGIKRPDEVILLNEKTINKILFGFCGNEIPKGLRSAR